MNYWENSGTFFDFWRINPIGYDLHVFEVGYEKCDPLHHWGPGKKYGYMFHCITSGGGTLKHKNQTFHLRKGDGFLIDPAFDAYYRPDAQDPWEYYWVGDLRQPDRTGSAENHPA